MPRDGQQALAEAYYFVQERSKISEAIAHDDAEVWSHHLEHAQPIVREFAAERLAYLSLEEEEIEGLMDALEMVHPRGQTVKRVVFQYQSGTARLGRRIILQNYEEADYDQRIHRAAAETLLLKSVEPKYIQRAHRFLARSGDECLRMLSCRALGQATEDPRAAVGVLRAALGDDSVFVVRDAVTALGNLGPIAANATPDLEKLADTDDKQLVARVRVALRQIGER